jgi:hypothetical protein
MVIASCRAFKMGSFALVLGSGGTNYLDAIDTIFLFLHFRRRKVGTVYPTLTFIVTAKTFVIPTYKVARAQGIDLA